MNARIRQLLATLGQEAARPLGRHTEGYVRSLDELLVVAGEPGDLKGDELLGLQVLSMVLFPLVVVFILRETHVVDFLFEGPKQGLVYLAFLAAGLMFPLANIREKARKRQRTVALQLPDTLDLLTISVEAGLDFGSAMRRVVEKHRPGPLKDELDRFFKQTGLGRPRSEALREMANRVQLSDLRAVVSALIQADRLGVSIGPILRAQSDMLRARRGQRAEKAAQEAPVKMLAPLMICILPSVFIMILAPVIIKMLMDVRGH